MYSDHSVIELYQRGTSPWRCEVGYVADGARHTRVFDASCSNGGK